MVSWLVLTKSLSYQRNDSQSTTSFTHLFIAFVLLQIVLLPKVANRIFVSHFDMLSKKPNSGRAVLLFKRANDFAVTVVESGMGMSGGTYISKQNHEIVNRTHNTLKPRIPGGFENHLVHSRIEPKCWFEGAVYQTLL